MKHSGKTVVAFDTETALFGTDNMAPALACLTYAYRDSKGEVKTRIVDSLEAESTIKKMLKRDDVILTGANTAYDMSVLLINFPRLKKLIFEKYEKMLVTDVILRNTLKIIEAGNMSAFMISLANLRKQQSQVIMEKDLWRMRYGELVGVPIKDWPEGAVEYAVGDAKETLIAHMLQKDYPDEYNQARASFCLQLKKVEGLLTDTTLVEKLTKRKEDEQEALLKKVMKWGAYNVHGEYETSINKAFLEDLTDERKEKLAEIGVCNKKPATLVKDEEAIKSNEDFLRAIGYIKGYSKTGKLATENKAWLTKHPDVLTILLAEGAMKKQEVKYTLKFKSKLFEMNDVLKENGLPEVKYVESYKKDTKVIKKLIEECYQGTRYSPPKTAKGNLMIGKEVLEEAARLSNRDDIVQVSEYESAKKVISTYLSSMKRRIHPSYNSLVDTGRTSCKGTSAAKKKSGQASFYSVNVQNLPKEPGVRECIVAPKGMAFVFADFTALELAAFATIAELEGFDSVMAKLIREGKDLHVYGAAFARGLDYEELLKRVEDGDTEAILWRTFQKVINFGILGYMFAKTMSRQAMSWGIDIDVDTAEQIRNNTLTVFPEINHYFSMMEAKKTRRDEIKYKLPSGRVRNMISSNDKNAMNMACNNSFQGLAADGAKESMWEIDKARYLDEESVLYGLDCPIFVHDEFAVICPIDKVDEVAKELKRLMKKGMEKHTTVPVGVEATASTRWSKKMKDVYDEEGRLIPWKPTQEWLDKNVPDLTLEEW